MQAGTFIGGSNTNEDWTTNLADLNVASGAVFSGVEANVRVDALSGAGTIKSGFNGAGYTGFTFGVDNGSGTFSGVLANDSSAGNFTKAGSGTQILSGTNTYTGTTTVSGGTLLVNGSLAATSAVTVANGATLGGTGTVGGAVTVQSGGTLAPGADGVGTLTVGSAAVNGHLAVQVNGNTADRLTVTGNLDITNCTLDLSVLSGGLTQLQYIIASYGSLTGSQFAAVTGVPNGYQISYDTANKRIMLIGQLTQAPRNLSAVGGVGRVALGWQPTVHGSETTYQIERATSSGGTLYRRHLHGHRQQLHRHRRGRRHDLFLPGPRFRRRLGRPGFQRGIGHHRRGRHPATATDRHQQHRRLWFARRHLQRRHLHAQRQRLRCHRHG